MLQSKFQASLGYGMRLCLRKTKASESFGVRWSRKVSLEELCKCHGVEPSSHQERGGQGL